MNSTAEIVLQQGKYRIKHTLDRGEFGITYRATHVQLGQAVAIKTLRPSLRHHPDFAQYYHHFRAVTHRLSQCQHPNLVRVLDVFEEKGLPFVVMNYIHGSSLADKLQSRSPLPVDQALYYIRQIGAALKVIHQQGLLHCNLQPRTILQRSGSDGVTLIDFGINSSFTDQTTQPYRGNRNLPGGFAAIEQYLPHEKLTPATDIYSLAATLYYLLIGQPPLEAPLLSTQGTATWFSQTQPSLKRLHPDLSPSVEQMILAGLEVQQPNRPQTIDQWLALLPDSNPSLPPVEGSDAEAERAMSADPTLQTAHSSQSQNTQSRFLMQFLWLQRCTPILFVTTALFFGWLGFSFTRRYTQMVVRNLGQQLDSEQNGAGWSGEIFSDYDPSKPMFQDPSVKTKVIEPESDSWEADYDLDQADQLDSERYNLAEEWESELNQRDESDFPQQRVSDDPYAPEYRTDEYGWESPNLDSVRNNDEWETSEANSWDNESTAPLNESSDGDSDNDSDNDNDNNPYNEGRSGYSSYNQNSSTDDRYNSGSDYSTPNYSTPNYSTPNYSTPTEPNPSNFSENDTDWNSTPSESLSPSETPSAWTPEPTIEPESSSQGRSPSRGYSSETGVELSIPAASQSFSEFETDSNLSQSGLGLEEISVPTSLLTDSQLAEF